MRLLSYFDPERPHAMCPFCGCIDTWNVCYANSVWFVECQECNCNGPDHESRGEAIRLWNTRATGPRKSRWWDLPSVVEVIAAKAAVRKPRKPRGRKR